MTLEETILDFHDEAVILSDVMAELHRAEKKFPTWPDNIIEQAAIVSEESGELIRAALQVKYEGGNIEDCRKEAIQTAAMCIRFLKHLPVQK